MAPTENAAEVQQCCRDRRGFKKQKAQKHHGKSKRVRKEIPTLLVSGTFPNRRERLLDQPGAMSAEREPMDSAEDHEGPTRPMPQATYQHGDQRTGSVAPVFFIQAEKPETAVPAKKTIEDRQVEIISQPGRVGCSIAPPINWEILFQSNPSNATDDP